MNDSLKIEIINFLNKSNLFSTMHSDEMSDLLPSFDKIKVLAGKVLYKQGDESGHIYFLLKGKLIALLNIQHDKSIIIDKIIPLEPVGELGALSSEPRGFSVKATEDAELLQLPSKVFKELCYKYPELLTKISNIIIKRSLQRLKSYAYDKTLINVSIIYPVTNNIYLETLKIKLKKVFLNEKVIYLDNEISVERITDMINSFETEKRDIYIYLQNWNSSIFNLIEENITKFYLVTCADEKPYCSETEEILNRLRKMKNLRVELILLHQECISKISNTIKWLENGGFDLHHHMRMNNENDFNRIIRFMLGKANVLVLGGGGSKAVIHLGVIKALLESNISIDAIGGTSSGAGIAACFALTTNYSKALIYADKLIDASMQSLSIRNLIWPIVSLFSSNPLTKALKETMGNTCIEDLLIPYFTVSTDIANNRLVIHRNGLIWEAVRSSAAVPGIYPPLVNEGKLYFDGGLLNNLPVDIMREMIGYSHTIVASSLSGKSKQVKYYRFPPVLTLGQSILSKLRIAYRDYVYPSYFETFFECLLAGSSTSEDENCHMADILIRPDLVNYKPFFYKKNMKNMLIEIGYNETIAAFKHRVIVNAEYHNL